MKPSVPHYRRAPLLRAFRVYAAVGWHIVGYLRFPRPGKPPCTTFAYFGTPTCGQVDLFVLEAPEERARWGLVMVGRRRAPLFRVSRRLGSFGKSVGFKRILSSASRGAIRSFRASARAPRRSATGTLSVPKSSIASWRSALLPRPCADVGIVPANVHSHRRVPGDLSKAEHSCAHPRGLRC